MPMNNIIIAFNDINRNSGDTKTRNKHEFRETHSHVALHFLGPCAVMFSDNIIIMSAMPSIITIVDEFK